MFWRGAHQMIYSTDIEHRHSLCNTDASWRRWALSYIEVKCVEGGGTVSSETWMIGFGMSRRATNI